MVIVINMIITFYKKFSLSHHLTTSFNPVSNRDGTGLVDSCRLSDVGFVRNSFQRTTENSQLFY